MRQSKPYWKYRQKAQPSYKNGWPANRLAWRIMVAKLPRKERMELRAEKVQRWKNKGIARWNM